MTRLRSSFIALIEVESVPFPDSGTSTMAAGALPPSWGLTTRRRREPRRSRAQILRRNPSRVRGAAFDQFVLRPQETQAAQPASFLQHLGLYAYRRHFLLELAALPSQPLETLEKLEQLRPLAAGRAIGVARIAGSTIPGIDTETDLARANSEWNVYSGEPA